LLDTLIKDRNDCDVMPFRVNDDDKNALYVLFMTKHRFMDKLLNLKGDFKKAIYIAVYYGYLDIIKFLNDNGCPWNEYCCAIAAERGNLECLKYLHENGCPWDEETCENASQYGQIECLLYIHENGRCPWDEKCAFESKHGELEALKCIKHLNDDGWHWLHDVKITRY